MLLLSWRVSCQQTSTLPLGATDKVPNQCQALVPGSVLIRKGALQFTPPLVLRVNMTSARLVAAPVEQRAYTLPRVRLVERSTAIQGWPSKPPGLGPLPRK